VIVARAVQGVATGALFSAFTAALVELAPPRRRELGVVIGSVAPAAGLGLGALAAGAAVQFSASPAKLVFAVLAVVTSLGIVVAILSPETVTRRSGARRALRPELSIPRSARREFVAAVPVQVGAWLFAGLFLGLMPTIIRELFHINSGLLNGATVAIEPSSAAVAGLLVGRISPRASTRLGGTAMMIGAALVTSAVAWTVLPLLLLGGLIGGVGFGASYSGSLRTITPLVELEQRAGVFAALFTVAYLAFGVPVIIAGQLIPRVGLLPTIIGYGVANVVAAAAGLLAPSFVAKRGPRRVADEPRPGGEDIFVPGWPGCSPPSPSPGSAMRD
jgi:MFS family permease